MTKKNKKDKKSISIDGTIWELLEYKLPCSRSAFFERQARKYIYNDLRRVEDIDKEIKEHYTDIEALKMEKEKLIKLEKENTNNKTIIGEAMTVIRRISRNKGGISEIEIHNISDINYIKYEVLKEQVEKEGILISSKYAPMD